METKHIVFENPILKIQFTERAINTHKNQMVISRNYVNWKLKYVIFFKDTESTNVSASKFKYFSKTFIFGKYTKLLADIENSYEQKEKPNYYHIRESCNK